MLMVEKSIRQICVNNLPADRVSCPIDSCPPNTFTAPEPPTSVACPGDAPSVKKYLNIVEIEHIIHGKVSDQARCCSGSQPQGMATCR